MMGHARALINVDNTKRQLAIFKAAVNENLSVRQVEDLVRTEKDSPVANKNKLQTNYFNFDSFINYKEKLEKN